MPSNGCRHMVLRVCVAAGSLVLCASVVRSQGTSESASSGPSPSEVTDVRVLADLVRELQSQVQTLNSQLSDLRTDEQRDSEEARELRRELDLAKAQLIPASAASTISASAPAPGIAVSPTASSAAGAPAQDQSTNERLAKLEENQELTEAKVDEQAQTKVESGSKYRLRLSGIVLLNLFENRGTVDNIDFPQMAEQPDSTLFVSPGTFGGTIRQSQIKLQGFGPDLAGAHTSADVQFDFAGGFPDTWNGVAIGGMRLRTGTIRLDWTNTSVVAGQDTLFFAPLAPTSLATLAIPALSYAGNLWAWVPQVRVEHRFALSDSSNIRLQAGILDPLSGDSPVEANQRYPSWGEESGQPAYAARVSWTHPAFGQDLTIGIGGYYDRQNWGFDRMVDAWAGTTDLTLPLGKLFEFSGEFYRGRQVAGLGGGIGQPVVFAGSFFDPATVFKGVNSMGGWAQLKFKPAAKLEINGALGLDNPFAGELRLYNANSIYGGAYSKNLSPFVNFIYQVRSDVLFSTEYRYLKTYTLDSGSESANHINLSVGYIF